MISTHSIADYRTDLFAFLSSPPIEGFRQDPYFDSKGLATIGVGFNIEGDENVRRYVLNQLGVFDGQSDEEIERRQLAFRDVIRAVPDGDEVRLVNDLNAKLREYLGPQTTTLFMLDQTQSTAVFNQILGDPTTGTTTIGQTITRDGKQKELDAILGNVLGGPTAHNTKEYEALMSLLYNQRSDNPLIGPNTKLLAALQQDNRAEAWYEIRYRSNLGSSRGVANRRYFESDLFGLYNGSDGSALTVMPDAAEAKQVMAMFTKHEDQIRNYEGQFSPFGSGSPPPTLAQSHLIDFNILPARTELITQFALGQTIDGDVLVGQDDPNGSDGLIGTVSNDLIFGEKGNDVIAGREGDDILYGGAGSDLYIYNSGDGTDRIEDTEGTNVIVFDGQMLIGGIRKTTDPENTFTSLDGKFTYIKSGGDLIVNANTGPGGQLIINQNFQDGQFGIHLANAPDIVTSFGDPTRTVFLKVDHFVQVGIDPNGNPIFEPVFANFFDDASNNTATTADPGRLTPPLGDDNNLIHAGAGGDTIASGAGNDQLFGDAGADTINAGAGDDRVSGGTDNDVLDGQAGSDTMSGDEGDDKLYGVAANDSLMGGAGNDELYGDCTTTAEFNPAEAGNDIVDGGAGNDFLTGDGGSDVLTGGEGSDTLWGDYGGLTTIHGGLTLALLSQGGNDFLDGGDGNDGVGGGPGDDVLIGGSGNDFLIGDDSADLNSGGANFLDGGDGDELQLERMAV